MAAIMTKRGNADNILTYEFVCDSVADLAQLDPQYVTMGSTAIIIDGDAGFEIYMANGQKRWVNLGTGEVVAQPGDQEEEDNFDGGEDVLTGFWTQEEIDTYGSGHIRAENLNLSNHRISGKIVIESGSTERIFIPLHMNTNLSYPTWNVQDDPDLIQLFPIIKTSKNNYIGGQLIPINPKDSHTETVVMGMILGDINIDDSLKNATTLYFAKISNRTMQSYYSFISEQEDRLAASNEFYRSLPVVATYDLSNLLMENIIDIVLPDILCSLSEEQIEEIPYSDQIRNNQANIEINNQTITGNIVLHQDSNEMIVLAVDISTPLRELGVGISNLNMAASYLQYNMPFFICVLKTNQNNLIPVSYTDEILSETNYSIGITMEFENPYINDSIANSTELQFYRCDNVPDESKVSLEAFWAWIAEQTPTVIYDLSGVQFLSELDFLAPVPKVGDGMDYLKTPEYNESCQRNITVNNHTITGEIEIYNDECNYIEIYFGSSYFNLHLINSEELIEQYSGIIPVLKTSNNNLFISNYASAYEDFYGFGFDNEQVDDSFSNVTELQFYRVDTPPTNITIYEQMVEYVKTLPLVSVYDMSNVSFIDMENWENGGNDV